MNSNANTIKHSPEVTDMLKEIKDEISILRERIEEVEMKLDVLNSFLIPKEKPELENHLQETSEAIKRLEAQNKGLPVSRNELAKELGVHPNTAYVRAEKLVSLRKIVKFYGRELGCSRFKDKKAVYYSSFKTIYDEKFMKSLENQNKMAHSIAMTLLQHQPLTTQMVIESKKFSESEIEDGFKYLLARGLIQEKIKDNETYYYIRKMEP
ncbi:MAG: hypothetical protein ACTSW1_04720 [Candidatus Hodarchaeales archaeon]